MKIHEDEALLIARAATEGPRVLAPLIAHYQRSVATVLRRILGRDAPVEDLVHDVFVRAFEALDRLDERGALGPWLMRIAHNLAVDHLRRRGRWALATEDGDPDEFPSEDECSPPLTDELERIERSRQLASALDSLAPHHRMILLYQYYLDLDVPRIVRITGWSEKRIRNLSAYGRHRLRLILSGEAAASSPPARSP